MNITDINKQALCEYACVCMHECIITHTFFFVFWGSCLGVFSTVYFIFNQNNIIMNHFLNISIFFQWWEKAVFLFLCTSLYFLYSNILHEGFHYQFVSITFTKCGFMFLFFSTVTWIYECKNIHYMRGNASILQCTQ